MFNLSTPSTLLIDPCEDLKRSHELDYDAHVKIYTGLVENAGSRQELIEIMIQVREAQEADRLHPDIIQYLYQKGLSSPHNGNAKLDAWMKNMLKISDETESVNLAPSVS